MTLAIEGSGISLERFFGDIGLPGTGLSGAASLTAASGGAKRGFRAPTAAARSPSRRGRPPRSWRGRFGVPTSGGGALAIVNGRIGLEGVTLRFPQSSIELRAGLRIGVWQPDFDFQLALAGLVGDRPGLPELHGGRRRKAGATRPRRQRRDCGTSRRHVGRARCDRADRRRGRALFRGPLRQHPRLGGDARGSVLLPSPPRLRRRREPRPRGDGPLPAGARPAEVRSRGLHARISAATVAAIPGARLPRPGSGDREPSRRREPAGRGHGRRADRALQRRRLGAEDLARHGHRPLRARPLRARRSARRDWEAA